MKRNKSVKTRNRSRRWEANASNIFLNHERDQAMADEPQNQNSQAIIDELQDMVNGIYHDNGEATIINTTTITQDSCTVCEGNDLTDADYSAIDEHIKQSRESANARPLHKLENIWNAVWKGVKAAQEGQGN